MQCAISPLFLAWTRVSVLSCTLLLVKQTEQNFAKIILIHGYYFNCRPNKKFTKRLAKGQSLPTSKLEDFEKFCCSKWLDMRNKAWTGMLRIFDIIFCQIKLQEYSLFVCLPNYHCMPTVVNFN